jgi:hypothetical protein
MADDLFPRFKRIIDLAPVTGKRPIADALMRSECIVEVHVRRDQEIEVLLAKDDKMVKTLVLDRLNPALDVGVRIG